MLFEAKFKKNGKRWAIEAPLLGVATQGKFKADALAMLADAITELAKHRLSKSDAATLRVTVTEVAPGEAVVEANDARQLLALALRSQRHKSGESLAVVTERLGQSSRNAYARYEQGKAMPSADKLCDLLGAVAPGMRFVIRGVVPVEAATMKGGGK